MTKALGCTETWPWYNCNGWLGIKLQVTYLLCRNISETVFFVFAVWLREVETSFSFPIYVCWPVCMNKSTALSFLFRVACIHPAGAVGVADIGCTGCLMTVIWCLQSSYWCGGGRKRTFSVHERTEHHSSQHFEQEPEGLPVGIRMIHLRKVSHQHDSPDKDSRKWFT